MEDFGEDVVVSLGEYFWSRKDKVMMKKGTERKREGTVKKVPSLNQVIWKLDSPSITKGDLDTLVSMGDFTGANFGLVS